MENDSRYEVEGEIARGGMGVVLRVKDIDLDRTLAMKRMAVAPDAAGGASEAGRFARFMEEAQVTAQLDHPAIVPVHELGFEDDGTGWYTMKLVEGREFGEVIALARKGQHNWTLQRGLGVLVQVCQALVHAHEKGVVHRDLKPSNIMVGNLGEVYVMDWGLAKVEGSELTSPRDTPSEMKEHSGSLMTLDGSVMGTPEYMAPEQARGEIDKVGPQSDVYAVGAMLYHLLCGRPPFQGKAREVIQAVASDEAAPLPSEIVPELKAICGKAMARGLDERYCSARTLLGDLQRYLDGRVVGAYEQGRWAELKKWLRRNRGLAAGLGAFLLTLFALIALQWASGRRIAEALQEEQKAKQDAVLAVERMAVSQALSAGVHGERAKATYWFYEAARLAEDCERKQTHQVRAALAESRATLPWRALMVPPQAHGRIDFGPFARFLIVEHREKLRGIQVMRVEAEALVVAPDGGEWFQAAAVCPATGRLAIAPEEDEGLVIVLAPDGETELVRFRAKGEIGVCAFTPNGGALFVGTDEGGIYDFKEGRFTERRFAHGLQRVIGHAAFSPDGAKILTVTNRTSELGEAGKAGEWGRLFVFDWEGDGEPLFGHIPHWFWPNTTQPRFFGDGSRFVSQPEPGSGLSHNAETGEVLEERATVYHDFSQDEGLGLSSGVVFDFSQNRQLFNGSYGFPRLRPLGKSFIATRPYLQEVSLQTGEEIQRIGFGVNLIEEIAVSADGELLASWDEVGLLTIWQLPRFHQEMEVAAGGSIRFSPSGRFVVDAGGAGRGKLDSVASVKVRNSPRGDSVGSKWPLPAHLCDADFSPDEKILATAVQSGEVLLWEIERGVLLVKSKALPEEPRCVRWAPKGDRLAVMGAQGTLFELVRNTAGELEATRLLQAKGVRDSVDSSEPLKGLTYSQDGRWLVAWSLCEGVLIWDCETGEQAASPPCESQFVNHLFLDEGGLRFLDTSWERQFFQVRDWSFQLEDWRRPELALSSGWYFAMEQARDGRLVLSDRYNEWGLILEGNGARKRSSQRLRKLGHSHAFPIARTPWVVGVDREGRMQVVDARDDSFLVEPWAQEGTVFGQAVLSPAGNALAAVDSAVNSNGSSTAYLWNLNSLSPTQSLHEMTSEVRASLAALNAGGVSVQGEWTTWSAEVWLAKWQQFRKDYPEYHEMSWLPELPKIR